MRLLCASLIVTSMKTLMKKKKVLGIAPSVEYLCIKGGFFFQIQSTRTDDSTVAESMTKQKDEALIR